MIEQIVSAYRLPSQAVRDFLLSTFGVGNFMIELKDDQYRILIPRLLSEAEISDLYGRRERVPFAEELSEAEVSDLNARKESVPFDEPGSSKRTPTLRRQRPVRAPTFEAVPLMKESADGTFKLSVESASAEITGVSYSLSDERLNVDFNRGALRSLYTIKVSGGLTCKVFEVNACWSWVSTGGSKSRNAKAFKVAVKRLEQETSPEEFAQEHQNLKAITKGHHRNIVDFLNAFRYAEGGNIYYNFAFPLAAGNLKQLFRFSAPGWTGAFQHSELGTPPLQFPASFVSMASKTLWSEFEGLASGLAYLHDECQIVHSDIKPSNILLYECAQSPPLIVAKLTDFGLAVDLNTKLSWRVGTQEARSAGQYDAPEVREHFIQSRRLSAGEARLSSSKLRLTSKELKSGDVWKLGSVFVELLSFLVKGNAGVHEFRKFITTTERELTSDEISDTRFDDGKIVKDKVLDWILHLSQTDFRARGTGPILRAMLGTSLERPSASSVTQSMRMHGISPCFDGLRNVYITPADIIRTPPAIDRCKERIESWIGQQIDWWPLANGERSCPQDYCRISWEWNNRTLWVDVPKSIAQAYKDNCRALAEIPQSSLEPSDPANPSAIGHQESQSIGSSRQGRSARLPARPPTHSGSQSQPNPSPTSTPSTNSTLSRKPPPRPRDGEIYWCVDKAWSEPRITKLCSLQESKQIIDDKSLCEHLIKDYSRIRTWKGRWLSWKSCLGVDFIKFHRPYPAQDEVIKLKIGLPPSNASLWHYKLVSPEEVHMKIAEAQIIAGIHGSVLASGLTNTLEMIPKKLATPPQGGPDVNEPGSWGMHARQRFSLWKIMAWIVSLTIIGLVFVILWLVFIDRTDLQNAFVPYTFLATMVLIGMGVPQLLDVD